MKYSIIFFVALFVLSCSNQKIENVVQKLNVERKAASRYLNSLEK